MTGVAGGAELSPELREKALTLLARWDKDNNYSLGMLLDDFDRLLRARRQGALTDDDLHELARLNNTKYFYLGFARAVIAADRALSLKGAGD